MVSARRSLAIAALVVATTACDGNTSYLVVDVRTDFVPHVEFDGVIVEVDGRRAADLVVRDEDPFDGIRVAELELVPGARRVEVSLLGDNAVLYKRPIEVVLTSGGRHAVTVTAARACRGVRCADDEACINGACADAA